MRLITQQEACLPQIRALAQRGINYQDEVPLSDPLEPIIDAAYVTLPFQPSKSASSRSTTPTLACLELCMYAEGSRHQEEIIVTGTRGRLEAYLPENKVYVYQRPDHTAWSNRSEPPPPVSPTVYDCTNYVRQVLGDTDDADNNKGLPPTHGGYHYGSTAMEWYQLLAAVNEHDVTGQWRPLVSLEDGIRAVEIGLHATAAIVNDEQQQQQHHQKEAKALEPFTRNNHQPAATIFEDGNSFPVGTSMHG
jgi:myo-inositol 2-dehydrogenase / D-chiro-inositol 1-dehydrogenase